MARSRLYQDIVGNTHGPITMQGWNFPLPEDDRWSREGTEDSNQGNQVDLISFLADEQQLSEKPPQTVCRAATGSIGAQDLALTQDLGSFDITSFKSQQFFLSHHSPHLSVGFFFSMSHPASPASPLPLLPLLPPASLSETTHTETTHTETTHTETTHTEITHTETRHTETTHTETTHTETTHTETTHTETTHTEITHTEITHTETRHTDNTHRDRTHTETTHTETTHTEISLH